MSRTTDASRRATDKNEDVLVGGFNDLAIRQQLEVEVRALRRALEDCQRQGRSLRESEGLHRVILENVSDAVFLTDEHDAFTFICPNCDVIFGYAPSEVAVLGRISALLGNDDRPAPRPMNGEMIVNHECEVIAKGGTRRTVGRCRFCNVVLGRHVDH
jgi:PAS domain S-box-containing protein